MATDVQSAKTGSGSWGGVVIEDIRNMTIADGVGENTYASSSTAQKTKRTTGHGDESGSFDVYTPASPAGPTSIFPFAKGEAAALILKSSTSQTLYSGTAVIINIEHGVPTEEGGNVASTVTWGQQ